MNEEIKKRNQNDRLHINLGFVCNNNCIFCMESDREKRYINYKSQTDEEIIAMLEAHKGAKEVMFTSGEPTLHPKLPEYIKKAKELNYTTIGLITNARRLAYFKYAFLLASSGLNHIVISIHGHTDNIHSRLTRTKGSFKQTVAGIKNIVLLKKKFDIKVHTSTVLNKLNYPYIKEIYLFLKSLKVDQVVFNYIQAQGRGEEYFDALFPRYSDVSAEFKKFLDSTPTNEDVYLLDIPYCTTENLPDFARGFVERHLHYEVVSPNSSEMEEKYTIIDRDILDSIYKTKREECKKCKYFRLCTGVWKVYIKKYGWEEFSPVTH